MSATRGVLAGLALASLAGHCGSDPSRIVLGVALGASNHPGIELAVEEVNRGGGIGGVPLAVEGLERSDVGFEDPEATIRWADALSSDDELLAVIGHADSSATLAAASLYNDREIPHVVTIASHTAITDVGPWTFRLCVDDATQGRLLAEHAVRTMAGGRIAVFYVNDDYGRGLAEHFQAQARELGATIVKSVFHRNFLDTIDEQVIDAAVADLAADRRPDLVVMLNRPDAAVAILRRLRAASVDAPVLASENVALLFEWAGQDLSLWQGARFLLFYVPDLDDARGRPFVEAVRQRAGHEPNYDVAFAYDAVQLLRQAMQEEGRSRPAIRRYLQRLIDEQRVIHGVAGDYRLGPDRNAIRPLHIVELRDGERVLVETIVPGQSD